MAIRRPTAKGIVARTLLTNGHWRQLEPLLPGKHGDPGRSGSDNRSAVEGMLWLVRTGAPWRDLPECFGHWNTIFRRFRRWADDGVFDRIYQSLNPQLDTSVIMVDGSFIKIHPHGLGALRNGLTPDQSAEKQAIGRSRGGLNTKVMAATERRGRLAKAELIPGNAAENLAFPSLMDGIQTQEVIADKAYDTDAIRTLLANEGITATIPSKANRKQPIWWDADHYQTRHLVENFFVDAKQFRGIFTRYCKLAQSFRAFLYLAAWYRATKPGGRASRPPVYKNMKSADKQPTGQMQLAQMNRVGSAHWDDTS